MTNATISLIANIAIALSFLVGLVFSIVQVKIAARDRKERLTLDTLRNYQSPQFSELMYNISNYDIPATFKEWIKRPEADKIRFIQFSQEMESLGLLVAERFINIDLVDKTLGSFVITSWDKMAPLVADMREKMPDPFLSEYYQWLAEKLRQRMEQDPRKPFHERRK